MDAGYSNLILNLKKMPNDLSSISFISFDDELYLNTDLDENQIEALIIELRKVVEAIEEQIKYTKTSLICLNYNCDIMLIVALLMTKQSFKYEQAVELLAKNLNNIVFSEFQMFVLKKLEECLIEQTTLTVYKCKKCRTTLFNNKDIDFNHQFTPKQQYSYKRYKNV